MLYNFVFNTWYLLLLSSVFVEKLTEGKVFSTELVPPDESLSVSEKTLSVAELERAISDVRKILETVWEQVSVNCGLLGSVFPRQINLPLI